MPNLKELVREGKIKKVKRLLERDIVPCAITSKGFTSIVSKECVKLYKCSSMERYYTEKVFNAKCKKCRENIKGLISNYEVEGRI